MGLSSGSPPNSPPGSQQNMPRACVLLSALQSHAQVRGHHEAFFPKNKEGLYCQPSQLPHNTHLRQGNTFFQQRCVSWVDVDTPEAQPGWAILLHRTQGRAGMQHVTPKFVQSLWCVPCPAHLGKQLGQSFPGDANQLTPVWCTHSLRE